VYIVSCLFSDDNFLRANIIVPMNTVTPQAGSLRKCCLVEDSSFSICEVKRVKMINRNQDSTLLIKDSYHWICGSLFNAYIAEI
jgi:hypothetical protein